MPSPKMYGSSIYVKITDRVRVWFGSEALRRGVTVSHLVRVSMKLFKWLRTLIAESDYAHTDDGRRALAATIGDAIVAGWLPIILGEAGADGLYTLDGVPQTKEAE